MKELAVKNYKTAEGQKISQGGNEFTVKPIVEQTDVDQCRVNFVEVEPGNFAYGYHYHETDEEVFYIISGTGIVRTANGDVTPSLAELTIRLPESPFRASVLMPQPFAMVSASFRLYGLMYFNWGKPSRVIDTVRIVPSSLCIKWSRQTLRIYSRERLSASPFT